MKKLFGVVIVSLFIVAANAQTNRWQQRIKYLVNVNMNVATNKFTGTEKIDYWNNSPDTLSRIFFHLYWNAFQPNSMMDVRSRQAKLLIGYDEKGKEVYDWDERVKDRIANLKPNEIGYQKVQFVKLNGEEQKLVEHETILEVQLSKPLLPHSKTSLEVAFEAQVPLQIRRSGRDNAQGIRYSMSQWYPKLCEYDYLGWDVTAYVAREFYGVWGDFDVSITINKKYLLAATGTLQNANEIGFGYEDEPTIRKKPFTVKNQSSNANTLTWKFYAHNVHDFVWAADTAYTIIKKQVKDGPLFYIVHKKVDSLETQWQKMADTVSIAYAYIAKKFGSYPYKNYSFIQAGDGGMEYPMATLIKGPGVVTAIHELMHSWYQGALANNESLYAWMDEGFTDYAEAKVLHWLRKDSSFAFNKNYASYFSLVKSGMEEPMITPADHYNTNYASSKAAYAKGSVLVAQLGYIVGEANLTKILLSYYDQWQFKHPNPDDFIRVAEKISGMQLQWYKQYFTYTTKTIDYALGDFNLVNNKTVISLKRVGAMPMPADVLITYKDGSKEMHYIPMNMMFGEKPAEDKNIPFIIHPEWKWTHTEYFLEINRNLKEIKQVEIDPSLRMADVNRVNNKIIIP